jgi:outer membrane autotransporter protein
LWRYDNSFLLQTTAFLDENNQAIDLLTTRTAFNQVPGLTQNEKAVGGGLEKAFSKLSPSSPTNSFNQLLENLFFIDSAKQYALTLDELSGAQYAQVLQSVLFSLNPLNESITDRMDCNLNQPARMVVAGSAVTAGQQPFGCFTPHQVQAWARVWGGWNHDDGDANAPGFNENEFGVWGGLDYALNQNWFFGVAGGFFQSNDIDFARFGGVNGGSANYDGGQVAGYGGYDNQVWYDRAIVSGGFYSGEVHRNFAFQQVSAVAVDPSGHISPDVVSFYNEAGRRFWVDPDFAITPFVGVR